MALRLSTRRHGVRLVCAADADGADQSPGGDWSWAEPAKVPPGRIVATVATLSHRELAECTGAAGAIRATELGVLSLEGPGVPGELAEGLEALPYLARLSLGNWLIAASALGPDPIEGSGSKP